MKRKAFTATVRWRSPPQVAKQLGVDPSKIRCLIQNGELLAFNVATRAGGRPLWRIAPEALAEFLQRRQGPAVPLPRQRRRQAQQIIEFF